MSDLERLVLDHAEQMILLVEPVELRIVMANQVAQQSLGYSEAELLDKSIMDVESSLQDVFYWEDVRNGQFANIESQEGLYQCADGSMRAAMVAAAFVTGAPDAGMLLMACLQNCCYAAIMGANAAIRCIKV